MFDSLYFVARGKVGAFLYRCHFVGEQDFLRDNKQQRKRHFCIFGMRRSLLHSSFLQAPFHSTL